MSCDHCKNEQAFRPYSENAKKAGKKMLADLRRFASPLSVQEARDACAYCRSLLENEVRGFLYNADFGLDEKSGEHDA